MPPCATSSAAEQSVSASTPPRGLRIVLPSPPLPAARPDAGNPFASPPIGDGGFDLDGSNPELERRRLSDNPFLSPVQTHSSNPFSSPVSSPVLATPSSAPADVKADGGQWLAGPSTFGRVSSDDPSQPPPPFSEVDPSAPAPPSPPLVAPRFRLLFYFSTKGDVVTLLIPGIALSALAGLFPPYMTILLGEAFQAFTTYSLNTGFSSSPTVMEPLRHALLDSAKKVAIKFGILGALTLVVTTAGQALWAIHGARVGMRVQQAVYKSVEGREMAWFETGMGNNFSEDGEEEDNDRADGSSGDDSASLMGRFLSQTDDVRMAAAQNMGLLLQYTVTFLANIGLAFRRSWLLTLAILATIPALLVMSHITMRLGEKRIQADQALNAKGNSYVEQAIGAIPTVKAFNAEAKETHEFSLLSESISSNYKRLAVTWGVRSGLTQFFALAMFVQGFALGSRLISEGKVTAGDVNTVFWACLVASSTLQMIMPVQVYIEKGKVAMAKLLELMAEPTVDAVSAAQREALRAQSAFLVDHRTSSHSWLSSTDSSTIGLKDRKATANEMATRQGGQTYASPLSPTGPTPPTFIPLRQPSQRAGGIRRLRKLRPSQFSGQLDLKDVTFHYPSRPAPAPPALYKVEMFIPPRETTYIVGSSGSGKSTVAALLLGLYKPQTGRIEADEQGYDWLDPSWIRAHVGSVSQGTAFIIEGTVHENVALGVVGAVDKEGKRLRSPDEVTREEVVQACRAAMVHDFVRDLPDGYDTILSGEKGASLSGGQRQRIALARAWIRNPTVLILDEALSALDATTRVLVYAAIKQWRRNKTTICITHDLAPIEDDDFVYIMKDGGVVQQGYRYELARLTTGAFAEMTHASARQENPHTLNTIELDSELNSSRDVVRSSDPAARNASFLPAAMSAITDLTPARTPNLLHPDAASYTDNHMRELSRAWRTSSRLSSRGSDGRAVTPESTSSPPANGARQQRRLTRLSTVILSGRQATLRRVQKAGQVRQPRRAWTSDELQQAASVTINVAPTSEEDTQLPSLRTVLVRLFPSIPNKLWLFIGLASCVGSGALTPVFSVILADLMTQLDHPPSGFLMKTTLLILLVAFLDGIAFFLKWTVMEWVGMSWISNLRKDAFGKVIRQDASFFDDEKNTRALLMARIMKDGEDARQIMAQICGQIVVIFTMVIMAMIWAFAIGWQLTLTGLALGPIFVLVIAVTGRLVNKFEVEAKGLREDVAAKFYRTVANIKAIRSMSVESALEGFFQESTIAAYKVGVKAAPFMGFAFGMNAGLTYFAEAVMFYVGAIFVSRDVYTFTEMTQVFSLIVFAVTFAGQLIAFIPSVGKACAAALDLHRLVVLDVNTKESVGKETYPVHGQIQLEGVNFSYPSRPHVPVLKNLSVTVWRGECVGIVGASGSGKSTIGALIQRLYEPSDGTIRLDGHPLGNTDAHYLRDHIGVVSQHPVLFDASVSANIAYGHEGLTQDEIEAAAKKAHVHDFILSLPKGYGTLLGENANLISGGQAQRLQIARALARDREVLLLDECTSALDPENQAAVIDTIMDVKQGRTTIFITHKLAVMQMCDRLIVVSDGEIVEEGHYNDLINRPNGPFATLASGGEWSL